MITRNSIAFAYNMTINRLQEDGRRVSPRGLPTLETRTPAGFLLSGDCTVLRKGMNINLGLLESLMIIAGELDLQKIHKIAPKTDMKLWATQSDYGPRLKDQLEDIAALMAVDSETRRAVAYLNRPETLRYDFACSSSIQFLARDGALETFAVLRSWDVVYGLPIDIMTHSILGQAMARCLGLRPGHISMNCPSLHMYDSTADLAKGLGHVVFELTDNWPAPGSKWSEFQEFARNATEGTDFTNAIRWSRSYDWIHEP